jgi:hypothetical protein
MKKLLLTSLFFIACGAEDEFARVNDPGATSAPVQSQYNTLCAPTQVVVCEYVDPPHCFCVLKTKIIVMEECLNTNGPRGF